jgi:type IV pilus assembly protein PilB
MVNIAKLTKKRLGEILVSEELVSEEQVQEALKKQKETGGLLGECLVKLGYITEMDIARVIASQFGLPYLDSTKYFIEKEILTILPVSVLREHHFVPLDKIGNILVIAVSGLLNEKVFAELEKTTGCQINLLVGTTSQVEKVIREKFMQ